MTPKNNNILSVLPPDLRCNVVDYLELPDVPRLMVVNREFHQLMEDQEQEMFARFARRKFPPDTLDVSAYGGSWKDLVRGDNAHNGVYIRRMHVLSQWRSNRRLPSMHYINAIRCMIWDRQARQVHIGIEAFGNEDLREAAHTSIFQVQNGVRRTRHLGQRMTSSRTSQQRQQHRQQHQQQPDLPELERRLRISKVIQLSPPSQSRMSTGHDLCLLSLEDRWFDEPGSYYRFTYNGSLDTSGNDYACETFLQNCSSLRQCFQLGPSSDVPGLNLCEFVSRTECLLGPSNVLDWPGMISGLEDEMDEEAAESLQVLPASIQRLHANGRWGMVEDSCRSVTASDITGSNDSSTFSWLIN